LERYFALGLIFENFVEKNKSENEVKDFIDGLLSAGVVSHKAYLIQIFDWRKQTNRS